MTHAQSAYLYRILQDANLYHKSDMERMRQAKELRFWLYVTMHCNKSET